MKAALIQIPEKINGLLNDYAKDLEEAWANLAENEALNVNLSAKIGFDKQGKPVCEITISFIKEKIKGSAIFNWDDKQIPLLKSIRDICPSREGEKVTISSPGHESITLNSETRKKPMNF